MGIIPQNPIIPQLVPQTLLQAPEDQSDLIEDLQEKLRILNEDYELEVKNSKMLEEKCEEYLNQLQRSADIIESTKEKQRSQIEAYEEKIQALEDIILEEKKKNEEYVFDNDRLRSQIYDLKDAKDGDQNALGRLQQLMETKDKEYEQLKVDLL